MVCLELQSFDGLLESVEVELSGVELEAGVDDGVGDLGSVTELRREAANLAADAQDLLSEEPGKNAGEADLSLAI